MQSSSSAEGTVCENSKPYWFRPSFEQYLMSTLSRLRRAADSPILFARHANRLYHRRLNLRTGNSAGVRIFDEEWDSLLLLDACRYDMFERQSTLPGTLEHRHSRGSATTEFLRANFRGADLRDTVYVTANPQLYRNRTDIEANLHAVIDVWREDGWDEDHGTVLPETVTKYAKRAAERYPDKRLLVHYMQPHYPFIDSQTEFDKHALVDANRDSENVWNQLIRKKLDVSADVIWRLYAGNLDRALPHVEELLTTLDGRTVVTADHGNMVGERAFPLPIREWGHPRGIYTEQLVKVPWLVYENGPRRTIIAEEPESKPKSVDEEVVTERLQNLGYAE